METVRLSPSEFVGNPGFELEMAFTEKKSGLDMHGFATGAVVGSKFYMIFFMAPRIHYYEASKSNVAAMV